MDSEDTCESFLRNFAAINPDPPDTRAVCDRCRRPINVCWCPYLPNEPIAVSTTIYILQHPFEESRCLRTAPMLFQGLEPGSCQVFKGKRFNINKLTELKTVIESPNTLLMYPGPNAVNLEDLVQDPGFSQKGPHNLILLDGTWMQAKGIYNQNTFLQNLKQVQLNTGRISEYVIRTQPTEGALSTLETGAVAISLVENRSDIFEPLVKPLKALCDFQIQYGAVRHQSKQFLIENGLYDKPLANSYRNKIMKMGPCAVETDTNVMKCAQKVEENNQEPDS